MSFDLTQTAFLFNWVANSADRSQKGSLQQLADYAYYALNGETTNNKNPFSYMPVDPLIPKYGSDLAGGDWQVVWGPGVYSLEEIGCDNKVIPVYADNTAFVVHSQSLKKYIIAIAGTDGSSLMNWMVEDFEVGPKDCVNWSDVLSLDDQSTVPTGIIADIGVRQVSLGTAKGIWALGTQLIQAGGSPQPGISLMSFLKNNVNKDHDFIFTGHSLGGALAPTLAYWTKEAAGITNVYAMPTAGPTPGNGAYQSAWDGAFKSTPVSDIANNGGPLAAGNNVTSLNDNVINLHDVIPHGWDKVYINKAKGDARYPADEYFFQIDNWYTSTEMASEIGTIKSGINEDNAGLKTFATLLGDLQGKGDEADMTSASSFISAGPDALTDYEIYYLTECSTEIQKLKLSSPQYQSDLDGIKKLLNNLVMVHVWGYGKDAFGIPMQMFINLHPQIS